MYLSTEQETYKLFVSSWNVGGIVPPPATGLLDMEELLDTQHEIADIYILGFQEMVPLTARNIVAGLGFHDDSSSRICKQWNGLIGAALNKKKTKSSSPSSSSGEGGFHCLISKQMVGIFVSIWVRIELLPHIKHSSFSCVACGIFGCLGNKGAVSVRFRLHKTSFCFVCSHLASGDKEKHARLRNKNALKIISTTSFPVQHDDLPSTILGHDQVIWLGDLNYRIQLPQATTKYFVQKRQWNKLQQRDQLKAELEGGHVFEGWNEEEIKFSPTYKYTPNSYQYYVFNGKNYRKRRVPAWCDRIIWYGNGLKQEEYTKCQSKMSDHRPVRAIFTAKVKVSETVEQIVSYMKKISK